MTATLLDFSQRDELLPFARVIAEVQAVAVALEVPLLIIGAFARDLHVHFAHGMDTIRGTEDVDFALAVSDWSAFVNVKQRLIKTQRFSEVPGVQQRLRHVSGLPVDLVPFGGVESVHRQVDWPPNGEFQMNVFGFREALASAQRVRLPEMVEALVVSLPALALLKIIAWKDRHYRTPKKDAHDLMLIVANYLDFGNWDRLWDEFASWTEEDDFDTTCAGARMLGVDVAALIDESGRERVAGVLAEQTDLEIPGLLAQEMHPHDADQARKLLHSLLVGFSGTK